MAGLRIWAGSILFLAGLVAWTGLMTILGLPFLLVPWRQTAPVVWVWARGSLAWLGLTCGLRHEIRGQFPAGPVIIAARHQSAWETILFAAIDPTVAYVLKGELFWIPLYGWFVWHMRNIGVDRSGHARALRGMLRKAGQAVAARRQIVIFPEGTRTPPDASGPFHPGVAALYRGLNLPVVPVALNSGLFWPRRRLLKRPGRILLEFLPPIPPGLDRKSFEAELKSRIDTATASLVAEGRVGQN